MLNEKSCTTANLDTEMTWKYHEESWRECPHCKADRRYQEIRNYMDWCKDGQVFCTYCGTYIRTWEAEIEDLVHDKAELG